MNVVRIAFVGSPLLDIYAKCDEETLKRFNLKADNCVKATEEHDSLIDDIFRNPSSHISPGGSALNSARIAKWILGTKGEVAFIGCTGDDIYKNRIISTLTAEGVIPLCIPISETKTGISACLLTSEGKRSMITQQNAATALSVGHLNQNDIKSNLIKADHIFVVGYLLGHSADVVYALSDMCSENQVFSLSLSAEYICREYKDRIVKVMPRVDILVGNETEVVALAEAFSGQKSVTVLEALSIIGQLKRQPPSNPRIIVVTCGKEPVIMDNGLGDIRYFNVPDNVPLVDSVGCGDAFAGAFTAIFAITKNLDLSVQIGIKAATEIVQVQGCNPPLHKILF